MNIFDLIITKKQKKRRRTFLKTIKQYNLPSTFSCFRIWETKFIRLRATLTIRRSEQRKTRIDGRFGRQLRNHRCFARCREQLFAIEFAAKSLRANWHIVGVWQIGSSLEKEKVKQFGFADSVGCYVVRWLFVPE